MGKLVITDNTGNTTEHELDKERVTIGRQASNDIVLNDKAVSGRHAAVVTILEDSFLEDLDSTNGTQVNGQPVTKHPLVHGDVITMGRHTARFFSGDVSQSEMDKTMILRPGAIAAAMRPPAPPPVSTPSPASAGKPLLGKLRVTSGPNQGRELELSKPLTTIGKPGVQVAAITRRADGYYIVQVDGGAGRKLRINDTDIEAQPRRLADRDGIELAGTRMEFHIIG
jgi:hypothetical protein